MNINDLKDYKDQLILHNDNLDYRFLYALWLLMELPIHRYLMSNTYGRLDGAEKATRHIELCEIYIATTYFISTDKARIHYNDQLKMVHDKTQLLTDYLDEMINFPLDDPHPDYNSLSKPFFFMFFHLAEQAIA